VLGGRVGPAADPSRESNEPRTRFDASGASGGSTARGASRGIKKAGGPSGPRLVVRTCGGFDRLRLARDGHRSPAIVGADRRDRRPEPEEFSRRHSEEPSSCASRVAGGRRAGRQSRRPALPSSTLSDDGVAGATDDVGEADAPSGLRRSPRIRVGRPPSARCSLRRSRAGPIDDSSAWCSIGRPMGPKRCYLRPGVVRHPTYRAASARWS
jgi:hypothetical protein